MAQRGAQSRARDVTSSLVSVERRPGHCARLSCTASIDAPAPQVVQACETWATDLRWRTKRKTERSTVFHPYGGGAFRGDPTFFPDVEVDLSSVDRRTQAVFSVELEGAFRLWGSVGSAGSICGTFARGVCSELAARGVHVVPVDLRTPVRDRARLARIATCWWRGRVALRSVFLALVLAYVVTLVTLGGNGYPPLAAFAGLLFGLSGINDAVRERSVGRPALPLLVVAGLTAIACLALLVVSFFIWP